MSVQWCHNIGVEFKIALDIFEGEERHQLGAAGWCVCIYVCVCVSVSIFASDLGIALRSRNASALKSAYSLFSYRQLCCAISVMARRHHRRSKVTRVINLVKRIIAFFFSHVGLCALVRLLLFLKYFPYIL